MYMSPLFPDGVYMHSLSAGLCVFVTLDSSPESTEERATKYAPKTTIPDRRIEFFRGENSFCFPCCNCVALVCVLFMKKKGKHFKAFFRDVGVSVQTFW